MKKCILLVRVSTWNQDITQQTEVVKQEAIKDGYKEIIIIEDHESAIKLSEEERNGLNKLKQYIESDKNIDCVYVYEISRISRQAKIVFSIRDYLIERKIQLIILKPYIKVLNPDNTVSETSTIFFSIFAGLAENEMYIKKARMRRGVERAKAIGRHACGRVPFGYTVDKQHIYHLDESNSKIVKWIFESYIGGMSMRRIAKELKDRGVFKSTYLTAVQNINNILHSDYYAGRQVGRPPIITEETFDKAQAICKRNILHTDCKPTNRPCKGILYDRNNGFLLSVNSATGVYYSKRAAGVAVSFKVIEPIIIGQARKAYKRLYEKNAGERIRGLLQDILVINQKIFNADKLIEEHKQQLDKLEERIILGKVNESLASRLETKINSELKEIQNKKIAWQDEEHDKQLEYRSLVSNQTMTNLPDGTVYVERSLNIVEPDDDKSMVLQVINKVILDRPARHILNIEILFKDGKTTKLKYDTFRNIKLN